MPFIEHYDTNLKMLYLRIVQNYYTTKKYLLLFLLSVTHKLDDLNGGT